MGVRDILQGIAAEENRVPRGADNILSLDSELAEFSERSKLSTSQVLSEDSVPSVPWRIAISASQKPHFRFSFWFYSPN
jgi:hypothetical protein